ncbi:MAG: hypothetical protein ACYCWE_20915 [Eubacteriales bacterium]
MVTVKIADREYVLRFDGTATAEIQRIYGDIRDALNEKSRNHIDAITILTVLINEGTAYNNYMNGAHDTMLTDEITGMLLRPEELIDGSIRNKIIKAFNETWPTQPGEKKNGLDSKPGELTFDFARLNYIAHSLLKYNYRDMRFLYINEICEQFREYTKYNGMNLPDDENSNDNICEGSDTDE